MQDPILTYTPINTNFISPYSDVIPSEASALPSVSVPSIGTSSTGEQSGVTDNINFFDQINNNLKTPAFVDSQQFTTPINTPLKDTLMFMDKKIGYNPFDVDLEDTYAYAHPFKNFGNNVIQGVARAAGSYIQTLSTLPIAIGALLQGENVLNTLHENSLSLGINDFLNSLQNNLPTYRTNYERDHPILKWFGGGGFTPWLGNIGSQINNLGFTAGAIGAAVTEDAVIGFATGGLGIPEALALNAAQFSALTARVGRFLAEN